MFDLAVVMPVYNEEACIVEVIESWRDRLSNLRINFKIFALNDGSTDNTLKALAVFKDDKRIEVINKKNSGHGPTILIGYKMAADIADWVFQCDSDDEMKAEHFAGLWEKRNQFDALFGMRVNRKQNLGRKMISAMSRFTVHLLFGKGVVDVNTCYRLMRAGILKQIARQIPEDTFAPNVIISGAISKAGLRIYNHPVPYEARKTGTVSIMRWKLWRAAFKSFIQTLKCRPVIQKDDNGASSTIGTR